MDNVTRVKICVTLLGEKTTSPCCCIVREQNMLLCLSAGPWLISLLSVNAACSHAAMLSPIINRFLNKDVCLDLKKTTTHQMRCVGHSVSSGWFAANSPFGVSGKHLTVFRRGFSFTVPDISVSANCCISQFLYLRGVWNHGTLGHLQRGLVHLFYCRGGLETICDLDQWDLTHGVVCFHPFSALCCL